MAKKEKQVSTNELARMVQRGFIEVHEEIAGIREEMVTKRELEETRETLARAISELSMRLSSFISTFREDYVRV